jgi:hypothetical protein
MLEELFRMVQGNAQEEIINNPAIPNEHNNAAAGLATESIFNGLQGALANGGLQQVLNLFGGRSSVGTGNPLVSGITNSLVGSLMSKLGVNSPIASGIAASLVPKLLGNLVSRTSDPNDNSMDMNGIMSALTGGGAQQQQQQGGGIDFNNILISLTGGQKVQPTAQQQDNSLGMDDILKMLTGGGAQQQQAQPQQGGGMLNGLLEMVTGGAQQKAQQQQQQGGGIMDLLKGFM